MIYAPPQIPSYAQGFAPRDGPPANPNLWTGLQALWCPSLGPTGLTLFDQSPFKNDGRLTDMDPATDWVATEKGGALESDGNDDFVNCNKLLNIGATESFAICLWLLSTSVVDPIWWFGARETSGNHQFSFGYHGETELFVNGTGGGCSPGTAVDIRDGKWHHLVGQISRLDNEIQIWVDGQKLAADPIPFTDVTTGLSAYMFGRNQDGALDNPVAAQIASLAWYKRAVSPAEIAKLYADPHAMFRLRRQVHPVAVAEPSGHAGPLVNRTPLVSKLQGLCA